MTATTDTRTPVAPHGLPQWRSLARLFTTEGMRNLLWATGFMLAFLVLGALLASVFGWQLVVLHDTDSLLVEATASAEDGVTIVWSLFLIPLAAAIAAIVDQIMLACRARVLVANGATRRSVALALLVAGAAMLLYVVLVATVALLVVGRGPSGAMGLLDENTVALRFVGALAAGLAAGPVVVALFQRWHWWIGTVVLGASAVLLPIVGSRALGPVDDLIDAATGWWGTDLVLAVLLAGAYWLIVRRMPVR